MDLVRLIDERPELSAHTLVIDAVRIMTDRNVGAVAITDGRRIIGIFTERDLMTRVVLAGRDARATPLNQVMTSPVYTVGSATSIEVAAAYMRERHIRHLAVVDRDDKLLGLVAQRYILAHMLGALETKVDDLEGYIMADGPGG